MTTFDRERLDAMVAEGWLRSQRHPQAALWIYNYTERTQFEKHWTPETLACRGLILDADGAIVARPFPKFFNLHELPDFNPGEHGSYRVTEKIDGSLGIVYWIDGEREPRIATRGSFTSQQAIEGTRRKSKVASRKGAKSGVYELTRKGREKLVGNGAGLDGEGASSDKASIVSGEIGLTGSDRGAGTESPQGSPGSHVGPPSASTASPDNGSLGGSSCSGGNSEQLFPVDPPSAYDPYSEAA